MEELKACPHCKGKAAIYGVDSYYVACCRCEAQTKRYKTAKEAVKNWNRRAEPENKPLTLEELRNMDGEPVWIPMPDGSGYGDWAIVDIGAQTELLKAVGIEAAHDESDYEKTWLAYARKPEGSKNK